MDVVIEIFGGYMLQTQIKKFPTSSGVYLFKDTHNQIIYIGKAKNLKKRVVSYFKSTGDWKTETIINSATSIDHITTKSELDALLLEATLIQQHQPKFNVLLKNGQPYIYILVTQPEVVRRNPSTSSGRTGVLSELKLVRNKKERGTYFGPFIEKTIAHNVYNFLIKTFRLKLCNKKIESGCLHYHMGLCAGTCRDDFDKDAYLQRLKLATQVLLQRKPVLKSSPFALLCPAKLLAKPGSLSKGFNERQSQNRTSILQDLKDKIKIHNQKLEFEKSKELQKYIESFETAFEYLNTDFSKKEHLFQYKHVWIGINNSLFLFSEKNGIVRKKQVFVPVPKKDAVPLTVRPAVSAEAFGEG
jgi:excinuclease UvrABC nuclease subunit